MGASTARANSQRLPGESTIYRLARPNCHHRRWQICCAKVSRPFAEGDRGQSTNHLAGQQNQAGGLQVDGMSPTNEFQHQHLRVASSRADFHSCAILILLRSRLRSGNSLPGVFSVYSLPRFCGLFLLSFILILLRFSSRALNGLGRCKTNTPQFDHLMQSIHETLPICKAQKLKWKAERGCKEAAKKKRASRGRQRDQQHPPTVSKCGAVRSQVQPWHLCWTNFQNRAYPSGLRRLLGTQPSPHTTHNSHESLRQRPGA